LISPANGATSLPSADTLEWSASSGAQSYRLQVSRSSSFSSPVVDDSELTATSFVMNGLAAGTLYYWHVEAENAAGGSGWSGPWSFTTAGPLSVPSAPSLISPADNANGMPLTDTLKWAASDYAASYLVGLSTYPSLDSTVVQDSTTSSDYLVVTGLRTATNYYWHVKGVNAAGESGWSTSRSFTTVSPTSLPPVPALLSPAQAATGQPSSSAWSGKLHRTPRLTPSRSRRQAACRRRW